MSKPHSPELNRDTSILVNLRHVPYAELSSVNGPTPTHRQNVVIYYHQVLAKLSQSSFNQQFIAPAFPSSK
ncbi:MAG: hypothetical protein LKH81_04560 [Acetobacter sp.]|jgi:hypothetical protein|nr:hypothetical protein [Acetobacter sp.]MCH4061021.1 hypothetical protein [Acetobacter sp.]MCI1373545.1 hypothetical protein [Acetobacter sp.]MCI1528942.1 hypothetical protein [Acetobacter sp.]MCI1587168.1 hypothetical protein [Acetobacter sp.]